MKKNLFCTVGTGLLYLLCLASCQSGSEHERTVSNYLACKTECGQMALAVKDQFLQAPREVLDGFYKNVSQASEDEFGRWLADLQAAFFAAPGEMTEAQETARQALIAAAEPLVADNEVGSFAERLTTAMEALEAPAGPTVAITGTYAYELPNDGGTGELLISQLDNEALRYSLNVVGSPPAYNQGFAEGEAWFGPANTANIVLGDEAAPCEIQLQFTGETVVAKTLQGGPAECGFGNGVLADGTYLRTSEADPFLPPGAEMSSNLIGEWVATDDSKSSLKIDGEQYTEIYDGQEMGRFSYEFSPRAPRPVAASRA